MVGFDRWYQAVSHAGSSYRRLVEAAFGPDQFVGQQGFAGRDQVLALAAAVLQESRGPLLDVCCGAGGPARCIATTLGAQVVGLDLSVAALRLARPRVVAGDAVRLPFADRSFAAALVLDSLASIGAPEALFAELGRVLRPGAGLGCTAEIGPPLSRGERARFTRTSPPTVVEEHALCGWLRAAGFEVAEVTDHTRAAASVAARLAHGLVEQRGALGRELGREAVDDLAATLASLAELLGGGRLAEVAVVARRTGPP
jgi:SAM-dependent methyltransferase